MKYLKVWTDFRQAIRHLSPADKGFLFDAMMTYAETGEEPDDLPEMAHVMWPVAKRDIDHTIMESLNRSNNGKKGGRGNKAEESNEKQEKANESKEKQDEAEESRKEKKRNEMKGNETKGKDIVRLEPRARFIPPTADQVVAYCNERGVWLIDPQRFIDYYSARGWILTNGKKMVDWKAAVRLWEKNERDRQARDKVVDDLPY